MVSKSKARLFKKDLHFVLLDCHVEQCLTNSTQASFYVAQMLLLSQLSKFVLFFPACLGEQKVKKKVEL